jgi:hypothetical protein
MGFQQRTLLQRAKDLLGEGQLRIYLPRQNGSSLRKGPKVKSWIVGRAWTSLATLCEYSN